MHHLKQNCDSKLAIYSHIKTNYNYEPYLKSHPYNMYITKFRLSDHYLPIERGRYMKPKIPRHERTCTLCKSSVGDEIHALFLCKSDTLYDIRQIYMKQIADISPQIFVLSDKDKLYYLPKGIDTEITPIFGKWLCEINKAYSPKSKT